MALGLTCGTATLIDHDPEWEAIATQTIECLWRVFGSVAKDIQHIGSTSIKGIKAKPSIGIVMAVYHLELVESLIPLMKQEGFIADYRINENECYIVIVVYEDESYSVETHSILVVNFNDSKYKESLCFRNYLNANPNAAKRYEAHKLDASVKYNNDRSRYKDYKSNFMKQILEEALIWSSICDTQ